MIDLIDIKNNIKVVKDIADQFKNVELNQAILDLKGKILDLQEEIIDLRTQNQDLQNKLSTKYSISYENGLYWNIKDGVKEGPFCTACHDQNQKLVRLKKTRNGHSCPICKNGYY